MEPLAQGMLLDQRLELADHLGMAAAGEVGVDRQLGRPHAKLVQAPDLGGGERLVGHVGERAAPPERERFAGALVLEHLLEPDDVDLVVGQLQLVAAAVRGDPRAVSVQQPAQLRDVQLHHLRCARRWLLAPQALGEVIGGDRPAGLEREHREHRTLLRCAERDRSSVDAHLDRPKEAQIHRERRGSGHDQPTLLPVEAGVNRV